VHAGLILNACLALAAVIALILAAARFLAVSGAFGGGRPAGQGALLLRATVALDTRRRLHLLQADGASVLVLTGGPADHLVTLPRAGQGAAGSLPMGPAEPGAEVLPP
jgi:hypothetical protein